MNAADISVSISLTQRRGLVTHFGRELCRCLPKKIGWGILFHPIAFVQFIWLYTGLLGSSVKVGETKCRLPLY